MARPRKFDENEVLGAVKDIFWRHGYEGASYPALIAASGLHKGSLYAAFGDKRALYLRALAAYDEAEVSAAVDLLTGASHNTANLSGAERINALLSAVIDAVVKHKDRRGCFLCNAAVDQAPHDAAVEEAVAHSFQRMQKAVEQALAEEKTGAALKQTASLVSAAYFGMRVLAKAGAPVAMLQQARNGALNAL